MSIHIAAIDLGASSGRVILARYNKSSGGLSMEEIHRFTNCMIKRNGHDCWDLEAIYSNLLQGLNKIDSLGIKLDSIGIDSWGVDFVLLDKEGQVLGDTVAYRDTRTDGVPEQFMESMPKLDIYSRTGIQFLKFNSIYQVKAILNENPTWLPKVDKLLFIPDYLHYRLTGNYSCEYTNASTSQMVNARTRDWDAEILAQLGPVRHWLLPLTEPGSRIGEWRSPSGQLVPVILPATHDTGSAIVATPLQHGRGAYISSGTWSLVGVEASEPVTDAAALAANLTNEGGVEGSYRILKNVMGLWLMQGIRLTYPQLSFAELVARAEQVSPFRFLIHPNDERFLNPEDMCAAIRDFCRDTGQGVPVSPGELTRCVLDSLACYYRMVLGELETVTGLPMDTLHIVGGGSQNHLLNRLCADICQRTVVTGPIEASALGNIAYQLKGLGILPDLGAVRSLVRRNISLERIEPHWLPDLELHWRRFCGLCAPISSQLVSTEEVYESEY